MLESTTYNTEILSELFTTREFEFINNIDSDIENIDSIIREEEENKKTITNLIDGLNGIIIKNDLQLDLERACKLAFEAKNIQDLVDDNINVLQINRNTYGEIKKSIINLLMNTENNYTSSSQEKFSTSMINLRNNINTFYDSIQKENLRISLNRAKIDNFLEKPVVKEYLSVSNAHVSINYKNLENISKNNNVAIKKTNFRNAKSKERIKETLQGEIKEDNPVLIVSEKYKRVYLPYSKKEILEYLDQYPNDYKSFADVVKQEFIYPLEFYMKHPVIARFRESYSLIRDRESKSVLESLKFAIDMMSHYELNPAIIAACKSQEQLENYLLCAEQKKIDEFKDFKIQFDVTPLAN